ALPISRSLCPWPTAAALAAGAAGRGRSGVPRCARRLAGWCCYAIVGRLEWRPIIQARQGRTARLPEDPLPSTFTSFSSLYLSTLLMLVGSGLLSTYLGLRLSADNVNAVWIGLLMTGHYVGLVMGATVGHRLIARVGHIRAFVASAGVVTASVLCHALTSSVEVWLALRWLVGLGMMCQYMVLESWLNEQAESHQRGRVFAGYMLVTFLGLGLGQLLLTLMPELTFRHVVLVAICFSLCLVPVAV